MRATATVAVVDPPADFAFIFSTTACGERNEIDTFAGTYTNAVPQGAYNAGTRTVPLLLTPDELRAVYRQLIAIHFFAYPDTLSTARSPGSIMNSSHYFRVRANGRVKDLRWTDDDPRVGRSTPQPTMIVNLYTLMGLLSTISRSHAAVQQMKHGVSCT